MRYQVDYLYPLKLQKNILSYAANYSWHISWSFFFFFFFGQFMTREVAKKKVQFSQQFDFWIIAAKDMFSSGCLKCSIFLKLFIFTDFWILQLRMFCSIIIEEKRVSKKVVEKLVESSIKSTCSHLEISWIGSAGNNLNEI